MPQPARSRLPSATPAQSLAVFVAAASVASATLLPGFEGHRNVAYWDPTGKVWTICNGTTKGVKQGDKATDAECVQMTARDARAHGVSISHCVRVLVPPHAAEAMVSFAYNVGVTNFCRSTLARQLNEGDLAAACRQMNRSDKGKEQWVYSGGIRLPGLVKRRAQERAYCERDVPLLERLEAQIG